MATRTILVVDDEPGIVAIARDYLDRAGFREGPQAAAPAPQARLLAFLVMYTPPVRTFFYSVANTMLFVTS